MSSFDNTNNLPIYKKSKLIIRLVQSLVATLPDEDDFIQATKHLMQEDALIISSKIAGAEGGDLYSIRMQNAAIIRDHAMHLFVQVGSLRYHENYKDIEYVQLIRQEIEEFRLLFIEWVKSFDQDNHIWDEWGLFNPPGAIPPDNNDTFNDDFDLNDFMDLDED